jgi:rubrerythrin
MPLQKKKIDYIDTYTGLVVAVYESLNECVRQTGRSKTVLFREASGIKQSDTPRFQARYQEPNEPLFLVDTTRAWHCPKHKVWIRAGEPCPLCIAKKHKKWKL